MNGFTPAEQMVVCISREIRDGDAVGLGIGTALTAAGVLLAQRTHAPHLQIFVPAAGAYCRSLEGVALSLAEAVAARAALRLADLEEVLTEGLDTRHKQFFRPAQIDPYGNFNNTVIGSYGNPRIRLPGAAGIPEVTAFYEELYFYVPRHSPHCFVEKLDFLSGIGHLRGERGAARRALGVLGRGPVRVVSDLGVFGFGE
ncbi:MAG: CoA-transferase subunit beta, partial [Clostridia bacterium]|nr:CoA-transferase subunit beta [Clostridia bacterium]